jgi:hypothetical protein
MLPWQFKTLKRLYRWPPPSLSLLYFLCGVSPCRILRTFSFSWLWMIFACLLHSELSLSYGRQSVDQFVLVPGSPLGPMTRFYPYPFFSDNCLFLLPVGRPLWREDGSVTYSAIADWSGSLRTNNHTLPFFPLLRLCIAKEMRSTSRCRAWQRTVGYHFFFVWIPFYLQAVQIHSANGVKLLEAWRGVLSSTPPYKQV